MPWHLSGSGLRVLVVPWVAQANRGEVIGTPAAAENVMYGAWSLGQIRDDAGNAANL